MKKITTQKELRRVFWETYPELSKKKITDHSGNGKMFTVDTRCAFVEFVDQLQREGVISEKLADRVTL